MAQWISLQVFLAIKLLPLIAAAAIFPNFKCREFVINGKVNADCTRRGLVYFEDGNINSATRILELAHNEIAHLRPNMFAELQSLEELNLRDNVISKIDHLAFNGLHYLVRLDLSHNHFTSLQFPIIPPIISLNLSFNPLAYARIISDTLQELDMSACRLREVSLHLPDDLPNLRHLNLSQNNIKTIFAHLFQPMPLQTFQISRNPIHCNEDAKSFIQWLVEQNVTFSPFCGYQNFHISPRYPNPSTHLETKWMPELNEADHQLEARQLEQKEFANPPESTAQQNSVSPQLEQKVFAIPQDLTPQQNYDSLQLERDCLEILVIVLAILVFVGIIIAMLRFFGCCWNWKCGKEEEVGEDPTTQACDERYQ